MEYVAIIQKDKEGEDDDTEESADDHVFDEYCEVSCGCLLTIIVVTATIATAQFSKEDYVWVRVR